MSSMIDQSTSYKYNMPTCHSPYALFAPLFACLKGRSVKTQDNNRSLSTPTHPPYGIKSKSYKSLSLKKKKRKKKKRRKEVATMSTISRPEPRSGGKMVRPRRTTTPRTPYDRPPPSTPRPDSSPQNPNWLSRFILSPSRLIASGAGKVLSSVFLSEPESSDSDSDSDDEDDSTSEDEMDDVNDDEDDDRVSSLSGEKTDKTTEVVNYVRKEPQAVEWSSETKRLIAQLLMQESFSREECERLTHIIKSRVIDSPIVGGTKDGRLNERHKKAAGNDVDMPDLRSTAVIEAKKWFEAKKSGSNSKSVECGTCTLNTEMLPHGTEGEGGSPVDLAKSFMRARPLWASPSTNSIQLQSPLPTGIELFKEATPYSVGGNSVSSSKLNKDSPFTGSWNIQEELRKVRSRATEEMLRTRPSSKIDWSALNSVYKGSSSWLESGKVGFTKDKHTNFTRLIDVPLKWGSAVTNFSFTDTDIAQDRLQNGAFPPNAATTSVHEKIQNLGSTPTIEGRAGLQDGSEISSHGQLLQPSEEVKVPQSTDVDASDAAAAAASSQGPKDDGNASQPLSSAVERTIQDVIPDSMMVEVNCSISKEDAGRDDAVTANGFPPSASSMPTMVGREQVDMPSGEEHNPVGSNHDKMTSAPLEEGICELLSEASMEVPIVNENDSVAIGSQDSSSMHNEGSSQDFTRPNSKRRLVAKRTGVSEKQQGQKVRSRYNRKGRGRGIK